MDLKDAIEFHGHLCPGLVIGYRIGTYAAEQFKDRSEDEELVVVVENKSCSVDAIQVINGCTFGKGNLVFKDLGKHVYTFFKRGDRNALRISVNPRKRSNDEKYNELFPKVRNGTATAEELEEFRKRHAENAYAILDIPDEDLFTVTNVETEPPEKAMVYRSIACAECGEEAMETRLRVKEGKIVCLSCFEGHDI
ncbi:FmdE family protein [Methanococcoides burtonii]|uniref:Protein with Tungsten formylmethanofuran dehydrogenase, subunit E-like domain n=1 Tax=Methanococcoides burtonii (strain DSM 6242 / NBRC 107633 / OCM 468 / ACE-M) TaxID=259564 RepID=Q12WU4_METBU|nr:FmdE family protein [Methanococcoides burtonii]ABE52082.1 Protein with Tungsten formylmethanofuran dehydrogenase, subunit E-like domain [Methanococcoides burtonii DSM 6242]